MLRCPVCTKPATSACQWHGARAVTPECPCVLRCATCGHRFRTRVDPALVNGTIYGAAYHRARKTRGTAGFALKEATFRLHLRLLERTWGSLRDRRLLDVGCATGDFLELAREAGIDGHGIDVSAHAVDAARRRGLDVRCGRLEDADGGPYDVIHASHVLEHVADPQRFARRAFALLRSGGLVLVEVPNEFDDLLSTLRRRLRRARGAFDSPHLHYFAPASLRRLWADSGFREVAHLTYSHRRPAADELRPWERLRHVRAPNAVLRLADVVGRGRNLVLLAARPSHRCTS